MSGTYREGRNTVPTRAPSPVSILRICTYCNVHGDHDRMISHGASWFHGCCFVAGCGRNALLALPSAMTDRLTLGDLGVDLMRALIDHRASLTNS